MWLLNCVLLALMSGCVGIGGEQINLSHEALSTTPQKYTEKLTIETPVIDLREEKDRIGRATVTVFAITSGSVTTTSPVGDQMVDQIIDVLSSLGYQATKSTGIKTSTSNLVQSLLLKVELNEIWFRNYNWIYPLAPTWGDIKITVFLENPNGKKVFEKEYHGGGSSLCLSGHCAFTNATKEAMTEILNDLSNDFSSQSLRGLITTAK